MSEPISNSRLEAFCDGVFAIAITLLVIEIRIPHTAPIESTADLWRTLLHISPSIFAFALSFIIILVTWVNHHAALHLVKGSSPAFIYANGFLLLTVVFMPFPTSLIGEHILTDHAAPAVVMYTGLMAVQAISWIVLFNVVLVAGLVRNDRARVKLQRNRQYGYFAFVLYTILALLAGWFPLTIALLTTLTWIFWLMVGIWMKQE